ncbi:hypothetical protein Tco_0332316 [Tanacetum coccineum]
MGNMRFIKLCDPYSLKWSSSLNDDILDREDSDIEVSFVAESQPKSVEGGCSAEKRKNKRCVIDDFETE